MERQRNDAIRLVVEHRLLIANAAAAYDVSAEAVTGALLWDCLEHPYRRSFARLGPGHIHPVELFRRSEAGKVEREGGVPAARNVLDRWRRLRTPEWAIRYTAAMMRRHADNYLLIAGVDVSNEPGILCTLFHGGSSEVRAAELAHRREHDSSARPRVGDEMGHWVTKHGDFCRDLLAVDHGYGTSAAVNPHATGVSGGVT